MQQRRQAKDHAGDDGGDEREAKDRPSSVTLAARGIASGLMLIIA